MAQQVQAVKVWRVKINDIPYNFEMSCPHLMAFFCRNLSERPSLVFGINRQTQFPNIIWLRLFSIHLGPPWFVHQAVFTNPNEGLGEVENNGQ
jgi:hypothetical protein